MPESTPLTLEAVTQLTLENIRRMGSHLPTVIVEGSQDKAVIGIEAPAPTSEGRAEQMFVIGLALAAEGEIGVLQQVFFISEAWMSIAKPDKPLDKLPSQDPERKEVLIISRLATQPHQTEVVIYEMKRDEQGALTTLETLPALTQEPNLRVESPLLEAFAQGFLGIDTGPDA